MADRANGPPFDTAHKLYEIIITGSDRTTLLYDLNEHFLI